MDYVNEMVIDAVVDCPFYGDDVFTRDYRGTIEIVTTGFRGPEWFVRIASNIQGRGWRPRDFRNPQRMLIGVEFDCEPKVAVVISIKSLEKWFKRYNQEPDKQVAKPVPTLVAAVNPLFQEGKSLMGGFLHMMVVERSLYPIL